MKQYYEYEKEFPEVEIIKPEHRYVVYVKNHLEYFDTLSEADKAGKVVDKIFLNEEKVKASKKAFSDRDMNIYQAWRNDLLNECPTLVNCDTFNDFMRSINEYSADTSYEYIAEQMIEFERLANKMVSFLQ